ncbi:long-chain fatty acid transporter [Vibrio anguillarum]|uniref:outer membrane protein transport protein n=1 Tax=Vibrio anguillarum TaxID=55601 RepID=UPI00097E322E|nr:outer membrane protein transport protein [Vibrio anguillarum]AXN09081.1 long-chain fatty acid transporter [Vibrio anguillarum]AXN12481.1 long-chain fatty acid transporter [Vibrio anguillarum]AXN15881.1 long-chain fatty acid transporter [Vibrio anguillarum]AXN19290.1 long-chain fatty acid transporter [Vibrio anguillarum]MBT2980455.1 outer membrane protein transport protein [Vibrio anguillarum]
MIIKPRTLLALSILTAFNVHSAGFQVAEHSASGLGRAFSGEGAVADNASVIAHNPAAMTRFDTTQFSGALSIVDPEVDVYDVKNQQKMNDVAPLQVVPAAYYVSPINEKWAWGMGIFTTYGVATDYPNDIYAGDTSLLSVNLNPNIAYRVNEQLSLAAGINLVYAEAKLTRHKGALAVFTGGSASDNLVGMTGETVALGWNIGSLYEFNQNHRVGFAYRSAVDLDFDDGEFSSYSSGVATNAVVEGRLKITLPAMWEVSAFHQLTDSVALHYGYQRTDWSSFKELKATSSQCTNGECFYKSEKYEDSGRWSLGSTYQLNSTWTLRAGFAFDEQAGEATLSIPDSDRYWYSAGVSYVISDSLSIDAGFALVKSKSGTFTETNKLNETLTFESQGTAYLSAIQLNYTFN